jgi:hypothetical protein
MTTASFNVRVEDLLAEGLRVEFDLSDLADL